MLADETETVERAVAAAAREGAQVCGRAAHGQRVGRGGERGVLAFGCAAPRHMVAAHLLAPADKSAPYLTHPPTHLFSCPRPCPTIHS
jgi:hypothetical protein